MALEESNKSDCLRCMYVGSIFLSSCFNFPEESPWKWHSHVDASLFFARCRLRFRTILFFSIARMEEIALGCHSYVLS